MDIDKIISEIERAAPLALSHECVRSGAYDNSGFLIKAGDGHTDRVLFALDLCYDAVAEAEKIGAKLIVTHHPAIYKPIKKIDGVIAKCLSLGISVYSAHLNMDIALGGVEDGLALVCGCITGAVIAEKITAESGFGRYFEIEPVKAGAFAANVAEALGTSKYFLFGDENREISKIATFCGAGLSEEIALANDGAELLVSADIPHHVLLAALENGKTVLQLTHYASEAAAMRAFAFAACEKLNLEKHFYFDRRFL